MSDMQVLRIGKISTVNLKKGTARVTYEDRDGATTGEIPFLAWTCWRPKIGETVLVGHISNGTTSAVILGPFWNESCRPGDVGTRTLEAEHIEFNATGDNIKTDVAELYRRRYD